MSGRSRPFLEIGHASFVPGWRNQAELVVVREHRLQAEDRDDVIAVLAEVLDSPLLAVDQYHRVAHLNAELLEDVGILENAPPAGHEVVYNEGGLARLVVPFNHVILSGRSRRAGIAHGNAAVQAVR